jgi:hypothetical protein
MLLRLGLRLLLNDQSGAIDEFGDVTNIALKVPMGHLWLSLRIKAFYSSKWNYLWYGPALLTVVVVFLSPLLVCGFFVRQLFAARELALAFVYTGLLLPSLTFFLLLAGTAAILGAGEGAIRVEDEIAKTGAITSDLLKLIKDRKQQVQDDSK